MALNGTWIPQTPAEERLMEDIHIATRRAHEDGASRERIAALCAFMASATLDPASEEDIEQRDSRRTMEEAMEEQAEEDVAESTSNNEPEDCPDCGDPIERVIAGMGGELVVQPCGCSFRWEDQVDDNVLGDWGEQYEPEVPDE